MMTAYSEHPKVIEARDIGVNEYLVKPFSAAQLLKRIQTIVEHPRPFVRTENFFGPDRRRRSKSNYSGQERRVTKEDADS
nr:response regulator [Alphaproteobacteria bacterium]